MANLKIESSKREGLRSYMKYTYMRTKIIKIAKKKNTKENENGRQAKRRQKKKQKKALVLL